VFRRINLTGKKCIGASYLRPIIDQENIESLHFFCDNLEAALKNLDNLILMLMNCMRRRSFFIISFKKKRGFQKKIKMGPIEIPK
jgi:hypothetical protein